MEKFKALKELVAVVEKDAASFYEKGNKAAGTRFRHALQQIKVAATGIRKEVSAIKKSS
jgi:hypothetical protein